MSRRPASISEDGSDQDTVRESRHRRAPARHQRRRSAASIALFAAGCAAASVAMPAPEAGTHFRDCADCPEMVVVRPGVFEMGTTDSSESDEGPVHMVRIERPFAAGAHEVTRGQFSDFVESSGHSAVPVCNIYETEWWFEKEGVTWEAPHYPQADDHPVVCVSWVDAQAYAQWLSSTTGAHYRLLSEAEWEYLAKRGSKPTGVRSVSHDAANYGKEDCCGGLAVGDDRWQYTAPVGSFPPDSLGLFDVLGNVWEWLEDCYHDSYQEAPADGTAWINDCTDSESRIVRGGSWGDGTKYVRSAYRLRGPAVNGYFTLGFRVARDLD